MKLEIISGPIGSGKTRRLRAIELELSERGEVVKFMHGKFTPSALLRLLLMAVAQGCTTLLIDDCRGPELDRLRAAVRILEGRPEGDIMVYAVEAA
jgi:pantothenate kinase-related protein Tda10